MRKRIAKLSEQEMLKNYPIKGEVLGWFFRVVETSNGAYLVKGSDQWGRIVSATGGDPEQLLKDLSSQASGINENIKNT